MEGTNGENRLPVEAAARMYETSVEAPEPSNAEISGEIPDWINGSFLRVGPGKFEWGNYEYKHWFDGEGLLHGFQISDGKVSFSSRFVQSMSYLESQKKGCPAFSQFGTLAPPDPCKNIFARFFSYFVPPEMTDNCNVNIVVYGKDVLASTEAPGMWCINPKTLETKRSVDVSKVIGEPRSWTAHPHYEADGTAYNVSTRLMQGMVEFVELTTAFDSSKVAENAVKVKGTFPGDGTPGYYHSFGITENYVVLFENSVFFGSFLKLFAMKIMDWSYKDLMTWDPTKKTKVTVLDKKNGEWIKTIYLEPAFVFHHVNCYEKDDEIVMDVCGYDDADVLKALYLHELRRGELPSLRKPAELRRYRLPLNDSGSSTAIVEDGKEFQVLISSFELPRINYNFNGKRYNYAYGLGASNGCSYFSQLVKVDVETKVSLRWSEENCYPSEPVFVQAPDAMDEDDGVVLSSVLGVGGSKSFLLFLDAKTFKEIGRATVQVDLKPLVHGDFIKS